MFTEKLRQVIHAIASIPQKAIHYISGGVTRIFSPADDNYPTSGVQPYEGDPANKKSS